MTNIAAGDLIPFHLLFPEIAARETRSITLFGTHRARPKTYGLTEAYCPDPTCDCRRVMINVVDVDHLEDGYLASISFGFDRDADMAGPYLDPLNPQSSLAGMLLSRVSVVLSDRAYVERLERHYALIKEAAASPAHPAHGRLREWLAEDDEGVALEVNMAKPKKPKKPRKQWVYAPRKPAPPKVPETLKREVEMKANALVETVLKPRHVKPPQDLRFNYIVDLYTKWYHSYFYFCSRYASPGPDAISPFFDDKFARLTYAGGERFNLSFMRYTGQWIEIFTDLTLDECLAAVRDDPWFHP